jgi:hypothetical protein
VRAFGKMLMLDHDQRTPRLLSTLMCHLFGVNCDIGNMPRQKQVCRSALRSYTSSTDIPMSECRVGGRNGFRGTVLGEVAKPLKKGRMLNEHAGTRFAANDLDDVEVSQRNPRILSMEKNCMQTKRIFQLSNLVEFVCSLNLPNNPSRRSASFLPTLCDEVVFGLEDRDEAVDAAYIVPAYSTSIPTTRIETGPQNMDGLDRESETPRLNLHGTFYNGSWKIGLGATSSIVRHIHIICGHSIRAPRTRG